MSEPIGLKPQISIILPVYDSDKYIDKALSALKNQTFSNIEIICINDGSNDNSLNILEDYANRDRRFKVYTQQNSGPAKARNTGLKHAIGEYIMFCDSDDWYESEMCQEMINQISLNESDLVMCNTITGKRYNNYLFPWKQGKLKVTSKIKSKINVFLWNKIFKNKLIKDFNIKFPDYHKSDDNCFVYQYMAVSKSIYNLNKKLYNHVERDDSIMDNYRKGNIAIDEVLDGVIVVDIFHDFLVSNKILDENFDFLNNLLVHQIRFSWESVGDDWVEQYLQVLIPIVQRIKKYLGLKKFSDKILEDIELQSDSLNALTYTLDIFTLNRRRRYTGQIEPKPIWNSANCIVIPSKDEHIALLSVTVQSIIDNLKPETYCDLIVTHENITSMNKNILNQQIKNKFISLRFYNVSRLCKFSEYKHLYQDKNRLENHLLLSALVLSQYERIIFLSYFSIIDNDINNLFSVKLENKLAGAIFESRGKKEPKINEQDQIENSQNFCSDLLILDLNNKFIPYGNNSLLDGNVSKFIKQNFYLKDGFCNLGEIQTDDYNNEVPQSLREIRMITYCIQTKRWNIVSLKTRINIISILLKVHSMII